MTILIETSFEHWRDDPVVTMSEVAYLAKHQEAAITSTGWTATPWPTEQGWCCPPAKGRFCQSTNTI